MWPIEYAILPLRMFLCHVEHFTTAADVIAISFLFYCRNPPCITSFERLKIIMERRAVPLPVMESRHFLKDICQDTGVKTRYEPRHQGLDLDETETLLK